VVTTLALFLLGLWNVLRVFVLAQRQDLYRTLGATLDPRLRLFTAALWAVVFLALALALRQRRPAVRRLLPLALLLYALYHLSLLAFFVESSPAHRGWRADALLYALAIAWIVWALHRPASRTYWREEGDGVAGQQTFN
jgi:hypothetical protein